LAAVHRIGGAAANRTPLAHTGLGDILYFRDLSERARDLGLDEATVAGACHVNGLCTRYKRVQVLAHSMEEFMQHLANEEWTEEVLGRSMYAAGVARVGVPGLNQILSFVPALALGGSEDAEQLEPVSAREHWDILFQL
jgi:hypothetical protein